MVSTAAVIAAVGLGLVATAGTYARWNASSAIPASTIVAGSSGLAITPVSAFPSTPLAPGLVNRGSFTVTNTGNVSLALAVSGLTGPATPTTFSQALTVAVASTTVANCAAGTYTPNWSGTFASWAAAAAGATVAPGSSVNLCVSVALSSSVGTGAQGQSAPGIVVALKGTQP